MRVMTNRTKILLSGAVVAFSVVIAYSNGMQGVFVYDDIINIVKNEAIRSWDTAVTGTSRPLTNLSFWLQYQLGWTHAAFFHAINIALHMVNALLLWRILYHVTRHIAANRRLLLSAAAALLWAVHPIHAESVTYIVQRAEVLSATFILAGLLLGAGCLTERRRARITVMLACFVLAYLSKPTAVVAPLLFFILDIAISGGVRKAWKDNRAVHILGMLTLCVPLMLLVRPHESSTSAGFGMSVIGFRDYLLFQPRSLLIHTGKLFWPARLLIEYGYDIERGIILPLLFLAVVGIVGVILVMVSRRGGLTRVGAAWFVACLVPVMLVPLADLYAEHRVYLASAGAAVVTTSALLSICRRYVRNGKAQDRCFLAVVLVLAGLLTCRAVRRNTDYRDDLLLWQQVVDGRPGNVRGHLGVGAALAARGELVAAEQSFRMAVIVYRGLNSEFLRKSFRTDYAYACRNLGLILQSKGEHEAGEAFLNEASQHAIYFR